MGKLVRARIRRLYVVGAIYFITAVTHTRRPIFQNDQNVALLRKTLREVKKRYPFQMRAYIFLPDHFHLLIHLQDETNISDLLRSLKWNTTLNYKKARHLTGSVTLWQKGFWDHVIRDERDFTNHFHYIHYNGVKHGYVSRPEDYPHSSYHEYVKRGWYERGWGHTEPKNLADLDFE
ncbi:MAG: transposase [Chloroflexota bacterium]